MPGGTVCAGGMALFHVTGSTFEGGLVYQWEASLDAGASWTEISGATGADCSAMITGSVSYRRKTTCVATGDFSYSLPAAIGLSAPLECICSSELGGNCYGVSLIRVAIPGTSLFRTSVCPEADQAYTAWPNETPATGTVFKEVPFELQLSLYSGEGAHAVAWIDYNQNGFFEESEYIYVAVYAPVSFDDIDYDSMAVGKVIIPATALSGLTKMRVRIVPSFLDLPMPSDACLYLNEGETEDFYLTVSEPAPCTGAPEVSLTADQESVPVYEPFRLAASVEPGISGFAYQFQVSENAGASWSNLGEEVFSGAYLIHAQYTTAQYRVVKNCSSGGSSISNTVTVLSETEETETGPLPETGSESEAEPDVPNCVPLYEYGCSDDDMISSFTLHTIFNETSGICSADPAGYSDYTGSSTNLVQGQDYTATISTVYGNAGVAIWIDYNDNGLFEAVEKFATSDLIEAGGSGDIFMHIPPNAAEGSHLMRVRLVYDEAGSNLQPCSEYEYGETEDYTVHILPGASCAGVSAPVLTGPSSAGCANEPFTLMAAPNDASGYTYAFESSLNGSDWTILAPSSGLNSYQVINQSAATWYRVTIACGGASATSAAITVAQASPADCYALPLYENGCAGNHEIAAFSFNELVNETSGECSEAPAGYSDYSGAVVPVERGNIYLATIAMGDDFQNYASPARLAIWIDYNDNGIFEEKERYGLTTPFAPAANGQIRINVPHDAPLGNHRMRVRLAYSLAAMPSRFFVTTPGAAGEIMGPVNPVSLFGYGETEDYTVHIFDVPLPVRLTGISAVNEGSRHRIECKSASESNVLRYELEKSSDAKNFQKLMQIAAANKPFSYLTYDAQPFEGRTFYRLKMVDHDGSFTYAPVVHAILKSHSAFQVSVSPNPVAQHLKLAVSGSKSGQAELCNFTGQVLQTIRVENGGATIDMRNFPQGMYLLRFTDGLHSETVKVIKN